MSPVIRSCCLALIIATPSRLFAVGDQRPAMVDTIRVDALARLREPEPATDTTALRIFRSTWAEVIGRLRAIRRVFVYRLSRAGPSLEGALRSIDLDPVESMRAFEGRRSKPAWGARLIAVLRSLADVGIPPAHGRCLSNPTQAIHLETGSGAIDLVFRNTCRRVEVWSEGTMIVAAPVSDRCDDLTALFNEIDPRPRPRTWPIRD